MGSDCDCYCGWHTAGTRWKVWLAVRLLSLFLIVTVWIGSILRVCTYNYPPGELQRISCSSRIQGCIVSSPVLRFKQVVRRCMACPAIPHCAQHPIQSSHQQSATFQAEAIDMPTPENIQYLTNRQDGLHGKSCGAGCQKYEPDPLNSSSWHKEQGSSMPQHCIDAYSKKMECMEMVSREPHVLALSVLRFCLFIGFWVPLCMLCCYNKNPHRVCSNSLVYMTLFQPFLFFSCPCLGLERTALVAPCTSSQATVSLSLTQVQVLERVTDETCCDCLRRFASCNAWHALYSGVLHCS